MNSIIDTIEISNEVKITLEVKTSKKGNVFTCCVLKVLGAKEDIMVGFGTELFNKIKKIMEV